jgi:hypothetical protein
MGLNLVPLELRRSERLTVSHQRSLPWGADGGEKQRDRGTVPCHTGGPEMLGSSLIT